MKILHITDSHGTAKAPESRTDVYYLSFLKKMYELKYVIQKEDIKLIIHTGDLFHSSRPSDKFAGQLAEIIKSYGIPMYVVPGNHDIEGYNINTLDQTKLGLLYKTGVVKELDREVNPIQLKSSKENLNISIVGQEYYKDIDTGNMSDFEMRSNNPNSNFNILCIHGYLCDKPQNPNVKHTLCQNIVTDADVILSGHFHESFVYQGPDYSVYNPGSLMRVEQTTYNKNHKPQYGILEIKNNNGIVQHTYTLHKFQLAEDSDKVFDYSIKNQKKRTLITLDNFKNSISNTNFNSNLNTSIENIISDVAKNLSVTQDIIDKTIDIYHDALNNSPDKLDVQQGFIADVSRKIIDSVYIENFQSHEQTTVSFKDGLNAIIGESNSGKTAILRAIRWALDNDPKGSDFITTGKDDCKVIINFNDGTKIERQRTRNDSGEYNVTGKTIQPDGSVTMWNDTYKGFANNIPVEISNIHQMPKVNLTKDICTHLNMMSQLDGPFLVTESPQVKAAIIGRLTGTQIIDLGIKDTNKIILNNSKTIKVYLKEKEEKENELLKYDSLVYHEKFLNLLTQLKNIGFTKLDEINKLRSLYSEVEEHKDVINKQNTILKDLDNEIECIKYSLHIRQYMNSFNDTFNIYKDIQLAEQNIYKCKRNIKWMSVILCFKTLISDTSLKCEQYKNLLNQWNSFNNAKNTIDTKTNSLKQWNNFISIHTSINTNINNIMGHMTVLNKDINNTKPLYKKYTDAEISIIGYNQSISKCEESITNTQNEIDNLIKQQEQLIKDNNICPCCGQKISANKYVTNINNFMKGR